MDKDNLTFFPASLSFLHRQCAESHAGMEQFSNGVLSMPHVEPGSEYSNVHPRGTGMQL